MTNTTVDIQEFIADLFPFNYLSPNVLENLLNKVQFCRYRIGQVIVAREAMPDQISVIYQGQARLLGYNSQGQNPATLKLLSSGEVLGWVSHVRGIACETAIASTEVITFNLAIADFIALIQQEKAFAQALDNTASLIEVYELLIEELSRRADGSRNLVKLARTATQAVVIQTFPTRKLSLQQLDSKFLWLVSSSSSAYFPVGSRLELDDVNPKLKFNASMRLVGLPKSILGENLTPLRAKTLLPAEIPYASEINFAGESPAQTKQKKYPYIKGRGPLDGSLACFQMLSQYFDISWRKDTLRRVLTKQQEQKGSISLQFCAAAAELMGLTTQMVKVPAVAVGRLQLPVMISWQDSFAIIYKNSNQELLIAVPEMGLLRYKLRDFAENWGAEGEVLLLQTNKNTPKSRFSLSWFVPLLRRYRKVLIEVLIASIVIQLFGLVNPLATQVILVEVMGGIQTVKAQNLEMRSRWQWQERYARYISAGFKTVSTQTTASSVSNFLNKFSSMLVLWVGAFLVLNQQLTLGQLIAFRILAGYVTSPLLRLMQLWQNFQETALSLQRLADILDTPQETEIGNCQNILMPSIQGSVRFENLSFSFSERGPMQLSNINLDFPAGSFVGIVGQSGSGKSTLLKLLPRLYEPKSGKILIDGYDISKVELYSLRRQIGMVLQDTLLFDGTVRENIALGYPDASDEEIIIAAKVAYAHDFIMSLPSGYNTRVGERGSGLSGGQRQRVA